MYQLILSITLALCCNLYQESFGADVFNYFPQNNYRNNCYRQQRYPMNMTNSYNPSFLNNHHYKFNTPYHNISQEQFSDINALEKYTLNRTYNRDNNIERLERLEMQAFGTIREGDINSRYADVRQAILSRPKQNYKTSLLNNLANYFSGQMTGYTPSFGNDSFYSNSSFSQIPYPTTYGNRSFNTYSSPFGNGYRINNYGTSSSAGVKIID